MELQDRLLDPLPGETVRRSQQVRGVEPAGALGKRPAGVLGVDAGQELVAARRRVEGVDEDAPPDPDPHDVVVARAFVLDRADAGASPPDAVVRERDAEVLALVARVEAVVVHPVAPVVFEHRDVGAEAPAFPGALGGQKVGREVPRGVERKLDAARIGDQAPVEEELLARTDRKRPLDGGRRKTQQPHREHDSESGSHGTGARPRSRYIDTPHVGRVTEANIMDVPGALESLERQGLRTLGRAQAGRFVDLRIREDFASSGCQVSLSGGFSEPRFDAWRAP